MNTSGYSHTTSRHINAKYKKKRSGWTPLGVAALVLGFMVAWPIGLAVLAYILWGGRVDDLVSDGIAMLRDIGKPAPTSSGNAAFDQYKAETLADLERQQAEFADYVENLRQARDREEFEHFMKSRKSKNTDTKK